MISFLKVTSYSGKPLGKLQLIYTEEHKKIMRNKNLKNDFAFRRL